MTAPDMIAPDVRTVPGVELIRVGTWQPSSGGTWIVTPDCLTDAVAAHRAAIIRRPVVKLGHRPIGDASPALGHVDNLRVADAGSVLVGDLVGVPAKLADLIPLAYPDRSVEALLDYHAPDGRVYRVVLTAVALLGSDLPAVLSLRSLADVGALYGVDVAASAGRLVCASAAPRPAAPTDQGAAVAVASARARRRRRTRAGVPIPRSEP